MKPSIYHVKFVSAQKSYGEGLAVFKDGTVNGGDNGYLYLGSYQESGGTVTAKLKIKKWNPGVVSVFGNISEFNLDLSGTLTADTFTVKGGIPQMLGATIVIEGRRIADAV